MTYLPDAEDLGFIKKHIAHLHCRLDLLNNDMITIDSLAGLVTDGSITIDANSDVRRTFTANIYLNKNSVISAYDEAEWASKNVHVYIGYGRRDGTIKWYSQGVYAFSENGYSYDATTRTLNISCVDLVAKLNGDLSGQLVGYATKVPEYSNVRDAIKKTYELSGMKKSMIDYWKKSVPYDLEYGTGSTIWDILTELRDLYYPFEMYFDNDTFVCREIPSGYEDPPVLDADLFKSLVISEDATVDYTAVRNCVEVFGKTLEADAYCDAPTFDTSSNTLKLTVANGSTTSEMSVSFVCPVNLTENINVLLINTVTSTDSSGKESSADITCGPFPLYSAMTDKDGNDVLQDASVMSKGKYYVIDYSNKYNAFYYQGQYQAHAMVKLVDEVPTAAEQEQDKVDENCDNIKYVCVQDPAVINGWYNTRLSIDKIGQRNEILSGGDYDNYTSDATALQVCEYECWKRCRLTDAITVTTLLIPWLNVNEKINYAARYLNTNVAVEWIVKSISINLGEGTMNIQMTRYFPYYPYIVTGKYNDKGGST